MYCIKYVENGIFEFLNMLVLPRDMMIQTAIQFSQDELH